MNAAFLIIGKSGYASNFLTGSSVDRPPLLRHRSRGKMQPHPAWYSAVVGSPASDCTARTVQRWWGNLAPIRSVPSGRYVRKQH
jgi:hypothetical protein